VNGVIMAVITRPNLGSMLDCLLFDLDWLDLPCVD
jgi:hypothetical protein